MSHRRRDELIRDLLPELGTVGTAQKLNIPVDRVKRARVRQRVDSTNKGDARTHHILTVVAALGVRAAAERLMLPMAKVRAAIERAKAGAQ